MVYSVIVLASRLPGVTHEEFKRRYEQHIPLAQKLSGDAMPLLHTRTYLQHDGPDDKPLLLAGNVEDTNYDCIIQMTFAEKDGFEKFSGALMTAEAGAKIEADEAGFWDRSKMKVIVVGEVKETKKEA